MKSKDVKFYKKYRHVGYSYAGVPIGWNNIVERAVIDIEKAMWPRWMPMFLKRWIHYLATGNSVVRVKFRWAYSLRQKLTGGCMITDIKDKYAGLRIYCYGNSEMNDIIDRAEDECDKTCEICSSNEDVEIYDHGWMYNLCAKCRVIKEEKYNEYIKSKEKK